MSNKSGVSSQAISLPKGGGALRGIGDKFSPDLHTGTGNFTAPIALPPGRNGFQPQLNLGFSTGTGNGIFGLGWSLGIPGVSRKTAKGIPRYDDTNDVFILSGAEDLVPVKSLNGITCYRPRTEGLFARIEHHRNATGNYWEVRSKDGLVSLYGTPRPANAEQNWADPAVIANPDRREHIFAWQLTSTSDPFSSTSLSICNPASPRMSPLSIPSSKLRWKRTFRSLCTRGGQKGVVPKDEQGFRYDAYISFVDREPDAT